MKKIEAIIKPFKLDEVKDALAEIGLAGVTIIEAKGCVRENGYAEIYQRGEYTVDVLPMMKIELVVTDDHVNQAVSVIVKTAKTGKVGDGKVFVCNVESAVRIRTNETGDNAL